MIQKSSEGKLRLFTGIAVPAATHAKLADLIRQLKPMARIHWSPASNFHITTKFIGAWPQDRLDAMKQELATLQGRGSFRIAIRGLGFFPNARSPKVLWAGVSGGAPLADLASRTDAACANMGVEPEKKAYSPHLTLARINADADLDALHAAIANGPAPEFGAVDARSFHLYMSHMGRQGSLYTSLAEFPL